MDEVKLEAWKERFNEETKNIQMEFDAFFKSKNLGEWYTLSLDESDELSLSISDNLPREVRERLIKTLLITKPEDSI